MAKQVKIDFRAYLLADSPVATLIGTRAFSGRAPQKTAFPYVAFHFIGEDRGKTHDYAGTGPQVFDVQVDSYAETTTGAEELGDAVRLALEGKNFTQGATVFDWIFADDEFDNHEDAARDDGSHGVARKTLLLRIRTN